VALFQPLCPEIQGKTRKRGKPQKYAALVPRNYAKHNFIVQKAKNGVIIRI
jgi:hypothetical protein